MWEKDKWCTLHDKDRIQPLQSPDFCPLCGLVTAATSSWHLADLASIHSEERLDSLDRNLNKPSVFTAWASSGIHTARGGMQAGFAKHNKCTWQCYLLCCCIDFARRECVFRLMLEVALRQCKCYRLWSALWEGLNHKNGGLFSDTLPFFFFLIKRVFFLLFSLLGFKKVQKVLEMMTSPTVHPPPPPPHALPVIMPAWRVGLITDSLCKCCWHRYNLLP